MKVSREGVVLIKSFQGFRPRAVQGLDGRWSIGYGHTASARDGLTVSEQDAELLLQYDLLPVVRALNEDVVTPLNQHQFDALASFAISIGVERFLESDVLQRLNAGHGEDAADALIGWPETATPETATRRRSAERALFMATPHERITLAQLLSAPLPSTPSSDTSNEPKVISTASLVEAPEPKATNVSLPQRYLPYSANILGPLAGLPLAAKAAMEVEAMEKPQAPIKAVTTPAGQSDDVEAADITGAPVEPMVPQTPVLSPFAALDETPLTFASTADTDFVAEMHPVRPEAAQIIQKALNDPVIFNAVAATPVLYHEISPERSQRFDGNQTGAFMIMGGVGLVSCAFSAGAFRLAMVEVSPARETYVVALALALIGVITVGMSAWNLYIRWQKSD